MVLLVRIPSLKYLFLFFFIFISLHKPISTTSESQLPTVSGIVDDCCCEVETVNRYNQELSPLLENLVKLSFFKYFKVNYLRECPFWAENYICQIDRPEGSEGGGCGVCECDEDEIPKPWKIAEAEKNKKLDVIDPTLGTFRSWHGQDEDVWTHPDEESEMAYLNLQLNPERYTGYGGYNATRIWQSIYSENCFPGPIDDQCFEERVFFRLISGFHASTTAHIASNFYIVSKSSSSIYPQWSSNLGFFIHRLGKFPDRIKNIYFTYLFLLRAVHKISEELMSYNYDTGNVDEDAQVKPLISSLVSSQLLNTCSPIFDEKAMFQGDKASLKQEFKNKFRNISELMDCVSCETCKVHAKLQVLGIGTALKILLSENSSAVRNLQRNEIIALLNTLQKLSHSIAEIQTMTQEANSQGNTHSWVILLGLATVVPLVLFIRKKVLTTSPLSDKEKKS